MHLHPLGEELRVGGLYAVFKDIALKVGNVGKLSRLFVFLAEVGPTDVSVKAKPYAKKARHSKEKSYHENHRKGQEKRAGRPFDFNVSQSDTPFPKPF